MNAEICEFQDRKAWAKWLDLHSAASSGVWVRLAKKGRGAKMLSYLIYLWAAGRREMAYTF